VAYRAEIEIGVRGAHQLKDLQEAVDRLSNDIDRVNKKQFFGTIQVANLRNYNNVVQQASANLQEARITLDAAGQASGRYATAINQYVTALGRSNAAQQITNDLVQKEISLREEAARVARLQASGIKEVTQYAGPIGPGPASAIDAPVRGGVSGVVASTIDPSRGVAIQKDRLTLEQALLNLQERKADAVFEELKDMEALVRSANEAKLIAAEATGRRPRSELSLAGEKRRLKVERKARAENLAQQAIQEGKTNQDIFNKRREYADEIFRIEREFNKRLETQEIDSLINQFELKERLQTRVFNKALEQDKAEGRQFDQELERRTTTRLEAAKKVNTERTRRRAAEYRLEQRRQKRLEKIRLDTETKVAARRSNALGSALIGGAFPLLFGQGVGAAAGGLVGGGLGGLAGGQFGFALSLVGTQIGTAVDSFSLLGQELNKVNPDVNTITQSLGIAGTKTQQYIDALVKAGREQEAAAFATAELTALIGNEGVNALKEFGSDTRDLANEFTRAMTIMGAAIAELVNRAGFLKGAIDEIERFNLASQAERSTDPEIRRLLERRRTETRTGPGGTGTDIALFESLSEQIIERQRELNRLKREGLDIDGVTKLVTAEQAALQNTQANVLRAQIQLAGTSGDILDDNVFTLKEIIVQRENEVELQQAINEGLDTEIVDLKLKLGLLKLAAERRTAEQRAADKAAREAERAAREAKRIQDEADRAARATRALSIELQLSRDLTGQNVAIAEARRDGNVELAYTLQVQKELTILAANIAKIKNEDLSTEDELLKIAIARETTAQKLNSLEQATLDRKKDIAEAVNRNLRSIQNEIDLSRARLDGTEEQIKIEQELEAIKQNIAGIEDSDLERIKEKLILLQEQLASEKAIQEVRDIQKRTATAGAGLSAGFIGQAGQAFEQQLQQGATAERATEIALLTQEMELAELQAQSLQNVVLGIGDAFATAMTTGVAELVAGTKSAEEVFSDFLKNVGNILLQTAQQMIATYIAIGIARAFAGLAGGGAPDAGDAMGGGGSLPLIANPGESVSMNAAGGLVIPGLAKGGPARAGQPYMVGERGPELFVPSNNGGVMRNEDMRQLMGRSPVGNAPAMNFTFETTNIGGQEFVSREQLEAAMATTRRQAANDGAKRGMNMTLDRMQNSPRTRARVGIA
jgi:hypothetical protein